MPLNEERFYEREDKKVTAGRQATKRAMVVLSMFCELVTVFDLVDVDVLLLVRQGQRTYSMYSGLKSAPHLKRFSFFRLL